MPYQREPHSIFGSAPDSISICTFLRQLYIYALNLFIEQARAAFFGHIFSILINSTMGQCFNLLCFNANLNTSCVHSSIHPSTHLNLKSLIIDHSYCWARPCTHCDPLETIHMQVCCRYSADPLQNHHTPSKGEQEKQWVQKIRDRVQMYIYIYRERERDNRSSRGRKMDPWLGWQSSHTATY